MAKKRLKIVKRLGLWMLENGGALPADYELDPPDAFGRPKLRDYFSDVEMRKILTPVALKAFVRIVSIWKLTDAEATALSGVPTQRTWSRIKNSKWHGVLSQDQLTRLSAMIGIYGWLCAHYSGAFGKLWIRQPNSGPLFRGQPPLDVLISGGIPSLIEARNYMDAYDAEH